MIFGSLLIYYLESLSQGVGVGRERGQTFQDGRSCLAWPLNSCMTSNRPGEAPPGSHRRQEEGPQRKDGLESQRLAPHTEQTLCQMVVHKFPFLKRKFVLLLVLFLNQNYFCVEMKFEKSTSTLPAQFVREFQTLAVVLSTFRVDFSQLLLQMQTAFVKRGLLFQSFTLFPKE